MKLSIVILTWNNIKTLLETLSILKDDGDYEIIVVDNGSTDGCQNYATIKNPENKGVSIGKNQGIKLATGEYVAVLDGDIVPVRNSLNLLVKWLEDNPGKQAIGFKPNKFTDQKNTEYQKHHEIFCRQICNVSEHPQSILYYGVFRREVFDKILFDESGPFGVPGYGWEETDFYYQMKALGIVQYAADINHPAGRYYHAINSSIKLLGHDEYRRTSEERHKYFRQKWGLC